MNFRVNGMARDTVPVLDRAVQYGDGLFETLRVRDAQPEFLGRHLKRLDSGSPRLRADGNEWAGSE